MSMVTLENAILRELKQITGNKKLKKADMMEWDTSERNILEGLEAGEEMIHCPENGVWVAVKKQ